MKYALIIAALLAGCRGQPSSKPPLRLFDDMKWQAKFQPEEASKFFPDGRAMRPQVDGTVAQGQLDEDDAYYRGKSGDVATGTYVAKIPPPVVVDAKLLDRGHERFDIYCSPCHDRNGSGQGMVVKHGYPIAANLTLARIADMPDGQIFDTITNGVRAMPSYRKQVPVADRWAIVAWVRVLGRAGMGKVDDVPPEQRQKIEQEIK